MRRVLPAMAATLFFCSGLLLGQEDVGHSAIGANGGLDAEAEELGASDEARRREFIPRLGALYTAEDQLRAALQRPIAEFTLSGVTLRQAFQEWADRARMTRRLGSGVPVDDTRQLSFQLRDLPADRVLRLLLSEVDGRFDWRSRDGAVLVDTCDRLLGPPVPRTYVIPPLPRSTRSDWRGALDAEGFVDLLVVIEPDLWPGNGGWLPEPELDGSNLHFTLPEEVHEQIRGLLAILQAGANGAPARIPPRTGEYDRANAAIETALNRRIEHVRFERQALREIIGWLRDMLQVNVHVHWQQLESRMVDGDLRLSAELHDVTMRCVLQTVLDLTSSCEKRHGYAMADGVLCIGEVGRIEDEDELWVYPLPKSLDTALVPQSPAPPVNASHDRDYRALDAFAETISSDTWAMVGGQGRIDVFGPYLIVRNAPRVQAEMQSALEALGLVSPQSAKFVLQPNNATVARDELVRQALERPYAGPSFNGMTADAALREFGRAVGVDLVVHRLNLDREGIDLEEPISLDLRNVPARVVLQLLLEEIGCGHATVTADVRCGAVTVSTFEWFSSDQRTCIHHVEDLVGLDTADALRLPADAERIREARAEALHQLITDFVLPDSWVQNGGNCRIAIWNGRLFVASHAEAHRQLAGLLSALRAPPRRAGLRVNDPDWDANERVWQRLQSRIPHFVHRDATLRDVFRSFAAVAELPICVQWSELADRGVTPDSRVSIDLHDCTLQEALRAAGRADDLPIGFAVRGGVVVIATREVLDREILTEVFDVVDVLPRFRSLDAEHTPAEFLRELIGDTIEPDSWRHRGGGNDGIAEFRGRLIVSNRDEVLQEIRALLKQVREAGSAP